MLQALFGNATAEKVLLYIEQYEEGYATAITDTFGNVSLNMVQRQLARFERAGLLASALKGRTRLYRWNPRYPFAQGGTRSARKGIASPAERRAQAVLRSATQTASRRQTALTSICENMAIEEVAALVCTTLGQHGIRAVLSGGAVVSTYSHNEHQSKGLDFIVEGISKQAAPAMQKLGFTNKTSGHWTHPRTEYWVEFPPGPVQVGDAIVTEHAEITTPVGVLRLLAPTECVMDRLAAYYHWNDPQGLEQAIRVAMKCEINLDRIEAWSKRERATVKFKNFVEELKSRDSPP